MTGKVQRAWTCTCGDQEMCRLIAAAVDLDAVPVCKPGNAVQGVDAVAVEAVLQVLGDRIGEAVLVLYQVGPVDRQPALVDALAPHQPGTVDDLGTTAQDLLRVAPTQRAGAAVGERVDDRDVPALRGALVGRRDSGHAGTDDDQVVAAGHRTVLSCPASAARSCSIVGAPAGPSGVR